jgi:hypothetical protein
LLSRGGERRIEMLASSFTQAPELLFGTSRLTLMQQRLARVLAARQPLAWQSLPFEFPVMREMIQYHRTRTSDAGLTWLVSRLHEAAVD